MDQDEFVEMVDAEIDFPITNFDDFQDDETPSQQLVDVRSINLPDAVKSFLINLQVHLQGQNVFELQNYYENKFNQITDKLYAKQRWPSSEQVKPLITSPIAAILYKELYYRHVYAKLQPTSEERVASFQNYQQLFSVLLSAPLPIDLPNQWIWDILDELIYQFQSFAQWRNKIKYKTPEEMHMLKSQPDIWNVSSVIDILHQLVQKSQINEQLQRGLKTEQQTGEFASLPLYKMLGYFALIGLLRIQCLLGDYSLALKEIASVELHKKGLYARVMACHVTTFYYVGFAYNAIKSFSHILLFISRTKQYHTRSYQYEVINKKADQMYALLSICVAICPTRVDENIHAIMREKHGEHILKMQRGEEGLSTFEELFLYACPKFVSPVAPNYDAGHVSDPTRVQLRIFLAEVKSQMLVPTLRSYLKLYTTLDMGKLAQLLGSTDVDAVREQLLQYKHKTRQRKWQQGSLDQGSYAPTMVDIDFTLKDDMVHITETKASRRIGEWFVRNSEKLLQQLE